MEETSVENVEQENNSEAEEAQLPSEQQEIDLSNYSLNVDLAQKYVKNGKLLGRFDNLESVFNTLKNVEDKHAQLNREIKSKGNQSQITMDEVLPLAQRFMENGMELTDDMLSDVEAKGIDVRDIKLTAMEIKEKVGKAYEVVGSKDNYEAMINWGKENISKAQQEDFNKALQTGLGEYAIKGLWNDYQTSLATSNKDNGDRVRGNPVVNTQVTGYQSTNEILRDKNAVAKAVGEEKIKLEAKYKAKLAKTPNNVIYGR